MKTNNCYKEKLNIIQNRVENGSAIAYGLIIIAVVSIILVSMIQFVVSQVKYGYYTVSKIEAFQIAESGINWYRWYLAHQTDNKSSGDVIDFWINGSPLCMDSNPCTVNYKNPSGDIIGQYKISVTPPDPASTIVWVTSQGWTSKYPGVKTTLKVRLRRQSWSDYAVLTNQFSHFDANWNIKGKVMSNTGVHFDGVANNVVYGGLNSYHDTDTGQDKPGVWSSWATQSGCEYNTTQNSCVFLAGKKYPVMQKDFTGVAIDLGAMKSIAQQPNNTTINNCTATGCYFDNPQQGRHIKFRTDGKFDISTVTSVTNKSNSIKNESSFSTYSIPNNGLIFINGDVWVEGTVNHSRVTVVAANMPNTGINANIYVGMNNLKYTNFDGSDVIGLIAQGDIQFTTDGPSDLILDAAFLAQYGGLIKEDFNPNCCGGGCEENKNSLGIFGSVASNKSLVFTVTKACNNAKAVGFQGKQINYDNNLLYYPPPYFPSDSSYSIDLWEEL